MSADRPMESISDAKTLIPRTSPLLSTRLNEFRLFQGLLIHVAFVLSAGSIVPGLASAGAYVEGEGV